MAGSLRRGWVADVQDEDVEAALRRVEEKLERMNARIRDVKKGQLVHKAYAVVVEKTRLEEEGAGVQEAVAVQHKKRVNDVMVEYEKKRQRLQQEYKEERQRLEKQFEEEIGKMKDTQERRITRDIGAMREAEPADPGAEMRGLVEREAEWRHYRSELQARLHAQTLHVKEESSSEDDMTVAQLMHEQMTLGQPRQQVETSEESVEFISETYVPMAVSSPAPSPRHTPSPGHTPTPGLTPPPMSPRLPEEESEDLGSGDSQISSEENEDSDEEGRIVYGEQMTIEEWRRLRQDIQSDARTFKVAVSVPRATPEGPPLLGPAKWSGARSSPDETETKAMVTAMSLFTVG